MGRGWSTLTTRGRGSSSVRALRQSSTVLLVTPPVLRVHPFHTSASPLMCVQEVCQRETVPFYAQVVQSVMGIDVTELDFGRCIVNGDVKTKDFTIHNRSDVPLICRIQKGLQVSSGTVLPNAIHHTARPVGMLLGVSTRAMRGPPPFWRLTGIEPATYGLPNCCSDH